MPEQKKSTFRELLEKHRISYNCFYEQCLEVPTEDITVMYHHHTCTRSGIEKMLSFINKQAGTMYTIEDVYIVKLY